jgi:hypothetical protein
VRRFGRLLLIAVAAAAIWLGFLLLLAVRTANPVTVNREQLLASDAVVVGVPERRSEDGVGLAIEETLRGEDLPPLVSVTGLGTERLEPDERQLVALLRDGDRFVITPVPPLRLERTPHGIDTARIPGGPPGTRFVYPATSEALAAAKRILASESPRPYE